MQSQADTGLLLQGLSVIIRHRGGSGGVAHAAERGDRNDDGDYEYIVELQQLRSKQTAKIWRDGALVGQADAFTLKPDVFYQIIFERSGRQLNLEIDGKTVISSTENKPAQNATLGIRIEGRPDHPAAIEIKDVELYYNR